MMDPCALCWTFSWHPVHPSHADEHAVKLRDGTFTICGYCALHRACCKLIEENYKLRLRVDELQEQFDSIEVRG